MNWFSVFVSFFVAVLASLLFLFITNDPIAAILIYLLALAIFVPFSDTNEKTNVVKRGNVVIVKDCFNPERLELVFFDRGDKVMVRITRWYTDEEREMVKRIKKIIGDARGVPYGEGMRLIVYKADLRKALEMLGVMNDEHKN